MPVYTFIIERGADRQELETEFSDDLAAKDAAEAHQRELAKTHPDFVVSVKRSDGQTVTTVKTGAEPFPTVAES